MWFDYLDYWLLNHGSANRSVVSKENQATGASQAMTMTEALHSFEDETLLCGTRISHVVTFQ